MSERKPYPSDVSDDEWAFVAPYLTLMTEEAPQREYPLCEVFNALCYVVRGGIPWRMLPNDLPPWHAAIFDSRTLQSSPESGERAGYDGAK
jgi:transposase